MHWYHPPVVHQNLTDAASDGQSGSGIDSLRRTMLSILVLMVQESGCICHVFHKWWFAVIEHDDMFSWFRRELISIIQCATHTVEEFKIKRQMNGETVKLNACKNLWETFVNHLCDSQQLTTFAYFPRLIATDLDVCLHTFGVFTRSDPSLEQLLFLLRGVCSHMFWWIWWSYHQRCKKRKHKH